MLDEALFAFSISNAREFILLKISIERANHHETRNIRVFYLTIMPKIRLISSRVYKTIQLVSSNVYKTIVYDIELKHLSYGHCHNFQTVDRTNIEQMTMTISEW